MSANSSIFFFLHFKFWRKKKSQSDSTHTLQAYGQFKLKELMSSTICLDNEVKCTHLVRDCFITNLEAEANFAQCWLDKCFAGARKGGLLRLTFFTLCLIESKIKRLFDGCCRNDQRHLRYSKIQRLHPQCSQLLLVWFSGVWGSQTFEFSYFVWPTWYISLSPCVCVCVCVCVNLSRVFPPSFPPPLSQLKKLENGTTVEVELPAGGDHFRLLPSARTDATVKLRGPVRQLVWLWIQIDKGLKFVCF